MNFGNAKTEVLKEPRGFIKIIQFFFSILAFACLVDWRGHLSFQVTCSNGTVAKVDKTFQYPFAMDAVEVDLPLCKDSKTPPTKKDFELNAVSPSQFFVFIGVMSFFASIIICAVYVLYEDVYLSTPRYAWADIILHGALSFLWFVSSCAYAAHIWKIKLYSSFAWAKSKNGFDECNTTNKCSVLTDPTFANLDIAALCGFVNVFLWGANIWFLYKETRPGGGDGVAGDLPAGMQDSTPGGGYEPYGPGPGMGGSVGGGVGAGGQWGAGQPAVQGGMNEI